MSRTPRDVPPPLELLCLNALGTLREGNVREVREIVVRTRPLAYTTVMTVRDRLVRKGKLSRRKAGRTFSCRPETSRNSIRRAALRELLESLFEGSEKDLSEFLAPTAVLANASRAIVANAAAAGAPANLTNGAAARAPSASVLNVAAASVANAARVNVTGAGAANAAPAPAANAAGANGPASMANAAGAQGKPRLDPAPR